MQVDAIRKELRDGRSPSLRRRRWIGTLAALGLADFAIAMVPFVANEVAGAARAIGR